MRLLTTIVKKASNFRNLNKSILAKIEMKSHLNKAICLKEQGTLRTHELSSLKKTILSLRSKMKKSFLNRTE